MFLKSFGISPLVVKAKVPKFKPLNFENGIFIA